MSTAPIRYLPPAADGVLAPSQSNRRIGVVMIHGFTSIPDSLMPWATGLAAAGAAVALPLLTGHGTRWQDMNRVPASQWRRDVRDAVDSLEDLCGPLDEIVVAGLSMGGTLALDAAAHRDVSHVLLVNPALRLKTFDTLGGAVAPLVHRVFPSIAPIADDIARSGISEGAYPRTPVAAVPELAALIRTVRSGLGAITAPVTVFRSNQDHVIPESSMRVLRTGLTRTAGYTEHRLLDSFHVATLDYEANIIIEESLRALGAALPVNLRSSGGGPR
ncbi:MAG: alpha/beta hydrolase [Micrococcaceae bacterium]